jgi:hypothetical protein
MEVFTQTGSVFTKNQEGNGKNNSRNMKSARQGGRTGGRIAKRGGILIP